MAEVCCGVTGEAESSTVPLQSAASRGSAIRMILEPLQFNLASEAAVILSPSVDGRKRRKMDGNPPMNRSSSMDNSVSATVESQIEISSSAEISHLRERSRSEAVEPSPSMEKKPKFGFTSVCGRRRDMEDAVSVQPSFCSENRNNRESQFFGVYDGHGCSHVAFRCKQRLHEILKEEISLSGDSIDWKETMERSFLRMDNEIHDWTKATSASNCRCELQSPNCDAVGSTAVVSVVTPTKIVVSNCGDSRAILCRSGAILPLSSDHKPDRPDELLRIENAGGRVIYWEGPRVLGVLAMSRAIGDRYLKPYVVSEPEVTITERTPEDECLILASDGLWDVVSNETACGIARMCLRSQNKPRSPLRSEDGGVSAESSDKGCFDASVLLTKLALARGSSDNISVVVVDLRRERQKK